MIFFRYNKMGPGYDLGDLIYKPLPHQENQNKSDNDTES